MLVSQHVTIVIAAVTDGQNTIFQVLLQVSGDNLLALRISVFQLMHT